MITKVFIAEDDDEDIEFFTNILSSVSPQTKLFVANNGIKFMSLLKESTVLPEFIFLDLNMPLKNGFECLQEIKNSDVWKNIKTVILSTSSQPEQIKSVYEMGADLYIAKPTSYAVYKNAIKKCLEMDWDSLK
jgi:DNA-binding NarL/FixJ family response regulator